MKELAMIQSVDKTTAHIVTERTDYNVRFEYHIMTDRVFHRILEQDHILYIQPDEKKLYLSDDDTENVVVLSEVIERGSESNGSTSKA